MRDCGCAIALRVNSTLACKAMDVLERIAPSERERLLQEADEHARQLREACESGEHGPGRKRSRHARVA